MNEEKRAGGERGVVLNAPVREGLGLTLLCLWEGIRHREQRPSSSCPTKGEPRLVTEQPSEPEPNDREVQSVFVVGGEGRNTGRGAAGVTCPERWESSENRPDSGLILKGKSGFADELGVACVQ